MSSSAGGVFLPLDPPPSTGQVLTTPTIASPTFSGTVTGTYTLAGTQTLSSPTLTTPSISGATITGVVTVASGATLTTPAVSGATITGVVTVASGATITTPTVTFTSSELIATGATGSAAAAAPSVYPAFVHCNSTGVSGAGVNLPTGACVPGAFYVIFNDQTGALNIYGVGATINGTTGTTAYVLTATGNRMAVASSTTAGAWLVRGNT